MEVNDIYYLDYSAGKLSGAKIKADGYGGVIRYIDAPQNWRTKHTNVAEYRDHLANGLKVYLVFEAGTGDADGGYNAGVTNAKRAKAGADALGYNGIIFFANDRPSVPNAKAWTDYLDGAASVLGKSRVGAYGFANALNYAKGHAVAYWQAGRRADVVGHAHVWQDNNTQVNVGGITCDRNLILKTMEVDDISAEDVFNYRLKDGNFKVPGDGTFRHMMAFIYQVQNRNLNLATQVDSLSKNLAAMAATQKTLVDLLSKQANMDAGQIGEAVESAVAKALKENVVNVDVDIAGGNTESTVQ